MATQMERTFYRVSDIVLQKFPFHFYDNIFKLICLKENNSLYFIN